MTAKPKKKTETEAVPESADDAAPAAEVEPEDAAPAAEVEPEDVDVEEAPAETLDPAEEIAALNDRLLRTLAEGENLRRRAQREREETAKYAITGFARAVLTVADNLRRALDSLPTEARDGDEALKSFIEGVELTERELGSILERHGIIVVDPLGEKFDHNLHEAMFEVPTNDSQPGTVVQVLEVGYTLNGRLLRAARVGVAKAVPEPNEQERVDTTA